MSGLLALLDDVATIAKVAATSLDDVVAQAGKAGVKAAGAVIDDAAVSPKYVQGFAASRELPIVGRIALGSIRNKLLILLPLALLLSSFAPWAIVPLLTVGGLYLCFEGAEKVAHGLWPPKHDASVPKETYASAAHLEAAKIAGAVKTDFILSAEIMTIALAAIPSPDIWMQGVVLALVGIGITAVVYGGVALIVKADDIGLALCRHGKARLVRAFGRGLVRGMPGFLVLLTNVGTAAMIWVGGSIVIHGLESFGLPEIAHGIEAAAETAVHQLPEVLGGFGHWAVTALLDGIIGLGVGLASIPVVQRVIAPLWTALRGGTNKAH